MVNCGDSKVARELFDEPNGGGVLSSERVITWTRVFGFWRNPASITGGINHPLSP